MKPGLSQPDISHFGHVSHLNWRHLVLVGGLVCETMNVVQPRPRSSVRGHKARVVTADISDYADYVTEVSPTACSSTGCLFAISWIFYVPSTAQAGHFRTNHTLTVTPYQVETQVTNASKKLAHGSTCNTINRKRIQAKTVNDWLILGFTFHFFAA